MPWYVLLVLAIGIVGGVVYLALRKQPAVVPGTLRELVWQAAAVTNIGRRDNNEDAYLLLGAPTSGLNLAAVADGMGGHQSGEVASAMLVQSLENSWQQQPPSVQLLNEWAQAALLTADQALQAEQSRNPQCAKMGSTVVLAVRRCNDVCIVHVGDSRAYRLRDGVLKRVTSDHSFVQALVDSGAIKPEQAARHPLRNVITAHVGGSMKQIGVAYLALQPGDRLLLCSDGLTDVLQDAQIQEILSQSADAADCAARLVSAACAAGARDNVTALVVLL